MNYFVKNIILTPFNILYSINPSMELQLMFRLKQGYKLDLNNPKTYNEKINWQKLYYKNDLFSVCSDKYHVRDFVEKKGCADILNTLIWEGFDAQNIPFKELPNQFVLKTTHGSGFNIICTDKEKINEEKVKKQMNKWLKTKFLKCYGESWYGVKKPRIIIEKYIDNNGKGLFDYKFFCFDGEPYYVYVDTWKDGKHHINMYDADFHLREDVSLGYPTDFSSNIVKPDHYEEMLQIARRLSAGFPHVRIDLYDTDGGVIFGEMTFSKGAGFDRINPYEFDLEMGKHFNIHK